jgi:hypothetical protein
MNPFRLEANEFNCLSSHETFRTLEADPKVDHRN